MFKDYYSQNFLYCVVILFVSIIIIKEMKKRKIDFKNKIEFCKIDYIYLIKMVCLTIGTTILLEQIQKCLNINEMQFGFEISIYSILVFFIVRCVVAPVTEEIIIRFGLFEYLNLKLNKISSIIITSILFSVIHGYLLYESIVMFILSIIWTYAYSKKNNIVYSIGCHFAFNIYAFICLFNINSIYVVILGVLSYILFLILLLKKNQ